MRLVKIKKEDGDYTLTFEHRGWFAMLFNLPFKRVSFVGSGTVWRSYPDFVRCDSKTEAWLADVYARLEHNG